MVAFDAMNAFLEAELGSTCYRIVHGEQKFAYERPVVPGDVLTATLTVTQRCARSAATTSSAPPARSPTGRGALVCTTQRHPGAPGGGGMTLETQTFTITRADLVAYAEASGDHNPIHQDETVAAQRRAARRDRARHVHDGAGGRARSTTWFPGAEVVSLGCKFTNPVVVPAEGGVDIEVARGGAPRTTG